MKLLIAASEAVPFCKTGGLGDVAGALARTLAGMGHDVRLFLPAYRTAEKSGVSLRAVPGSYDVAVGGERVSASLWAAPLGGARAHLVRCPGYFSRDGLYQEGGKDYEDNQERFIFFARAALEGARFVGFRPDAVHCHDWQAALIPAYLKILYRSDAFYAGVPSMLTIHNAAYQGMFSKDALAIAGFDWRDFTPERLEYYGGFNFLKAGIVFADALTTVSPTYAREIQSSGNGRGMEGLLRHRSRDLRGILNGIDVEAWNPETDAALGGANYGLETAKAGKAKAKRALQKDCGLAASARTPLIGIVSRLDDQKGPDVSLSVLRAMLGRGIQTVILGEGDPAIQAACARFAASARTQVHFRDAFDEPFSRRVYAASDIFLMPSRFEPCGLGQMIAMRYGAVPVVTRTGGLADTVREAPEGGNGFVAPACDAAAVGAALERALAAYRRPAQWAGLMRNGMSADFSWARSAAAYAALLGDLRPAPR